MISRSMMTTQERDLKGLCEACLLAFIQRRNGSGQRMTSKHPDPYRFWRVFWYKGTGRRVCASRVQKVGNSANLSLNSTFTSSHNVQIPQLILYRQSDLLSESNTATIKNVRLQISTLQHINQSRTCLKNRRPAASDRKLLGSLGEHWRYSSFINRYTQSTGCRLQALSILATEASRNAKKNTEDHGSRSTHRSAANAARQRYPSTATFTIVFLPVGDRLQTWTTLGIPHCSFYPPSWW